MSHRSYILSANEQRQGKLSAYLKIKDL